jgi:hypothetical protein
MRLQLPASLNHPNIGAIYGVEERALIMELTSRPSWIPLRVRRHDRWRRDEGVLMRSRRN